MGIGSLVTEAYTLLAFSAVIKYPFVVSHLWLV